MLQALTHDGSRGWRSRWRTLVVVVAICGLTVSLATRTFRLKSCQSATVTSHSSQPMRQHLDRDAAQWVPPVPVVFSTLRVPAFYPHVAPEIPSAPSVLIDESLSNRPPPSC
jgi:hypothetical protein